ncbi:hypothetical protein M0R45_030955 [Rubus argutus]|uniref:Uncharacterized protein n=1 Tax=Rubus argutus TaxID=59490 RepID=A0AAW1WD22_RUBAR
MGRQWAQGRTARLRLGLIDQSRDGGAVDWVTTGLRRGRDDDGWAFFSSLLPSGSPLFLSSFHSFLVIFSSSSFAVQWRLGGIARARLVLDGGGDEDVMVW